MQLKKANSDNLQSNQEMIPGSSSFTPNVHLTSTYNNTTSNSNTTNSYLKRVIFLVTDFLYDESLNEFMTTGIPRKLNSFCSSW